MLKLATIGAVAITASATHPINDDIVNEIKAKATTWTPFEAHLNPLRFHDEQTLQGKLGTIVRGP